MPILSAVELGHAFGAADLFHDLSVAVEARDRIGLVGPNGVGKTTLLLALAGLLEPAAGRVEIAAGLTMGYLRQEAVLTFAGRENTVYQEMLTAFAALRAREAEMATMEAALGDQYDDELLAAYGTLQENFEREGGYQYQNDVKRVLLGLGFAADQWDTPLLHLSGGQKTRVLLGRLLLERPTLLILDEPTNHLDVAAIEWLENTLNTWTGAVLVVSHDRYFLDRVANTIWEMSTAGVETYRGNYSAYLTQRQERWERLQRDYEAFQELSLIHI